MSDRTTREVAMASLSPLMQEVLQSGGAVELTVTGNSMFPMLHHKVSKVRLEQVATLKKYDLPLYQRDNGQYVLHRIVKVGETYTCIGDNQFVLEQGLREDQMIAIVTAFTRNGRRIEVTSPGYRLYCHLWVASRPVRHLWRRGVNLLKRIVRRCLK